jgi:hypothetical protein
MELSCPDPVASLRGVPPRRRARALGEEELSLAQRNARSAERAETGERGEPLGASGLAADVGNALFRELLTTPTPERGALNPSLGALAPTLAGPPAQATLARDFPGGAAGAVSEGTGGAATLRSAEISFELPAGVSLSSTWKRDVRTQYTTTVTLRASSDKIQATFNSPFYIDAQWPAQNMRLSGVEFDIRSGNTTVDVSLVDDEWGDGFVDYRDEARTEITNVVRSLFSGTQLLPAHPQRAPTMGPPRQGPDSQPGANQYNPLTESDPMALLRQIQANFQSLPASGESTLAPEQITRISAGGTVALTRDIVKLDGNAGVRIASGTEITARVTSGASVAELQQAAQSAQQGAGAQAVAAAANISEISISSAGIEVVKDGETQALLQSITIQRGTVRVGALQLQGRAAQLAADERSTALAIGGLVGLLVGGSHGLDPEGSFQAGVNYASMEGWDRLEAVAGIARRRIEQKLQEALDEFLAEHGRTLVPGFDLGSVIGRPGVGQPAGVAH